MCIRQWGEPNDAHLFYYYRYYHRFHLKIYSVALISEITDDKVFLSATRSTCVFRECLFFV